LLIKEKEVTTKMKNMIISSNPPGTGLSLANLATVASDYGITSALKSALGQTGKKHSTRAFAAGKKRKNVQDTKANPFLFAHVRYGLLAFALGGTAWFLAVLILRIICQSAP
jgi:hypothetical protein